MSVTTFFEKMIGLQQQRSQQKQNSYRELVAGIATGEEPSASEVERLLTQNLSGSLMKLTPRSNA